MNKKEIVIACSLGVLVIITAILFFSAGSGSNSLQTGSGGQIDVVESYKAATSTNVTVAPTDSQVLATSTTGSRKYCVFVNDGASPVYLSFNGGVAAATSSGIRLNASGGSYEMTRDNLYQGSVRGIAAASTTLTVTCF